MSGNTTRVVHVKQAAYDVYIGRRMPGYEASAFGNPFRIGRDGAGEEVLAKYRDHVLADAGLLLQLPNLKGMTLGCWCKKKGDEPCHGDVLVGLLEDPPEPRVLWLAAGGGTDRYSPDLYTELLIAWGHLVMVDKERDRVCGRRLFEVWEDLKDPSAFLAYVNKDGERLRLKRGRTMDAAAVLELNAFAKLTEFEMVGARGNQHELVNHKSGGVSRGVICDRGARHIFPTCAFCHTPESGERLCDWPTGNTCPKCDGSKVTKDTWYFMKSFWQIAPCYDCNGTGVRTCSKPVCIGCRRQKGKLDICPAHRKAAGLPVTPPPEPLHLHGG